MLAIQRMGLFLYIIGVLLGAGMGFCVGVLYVSGMLPFRLRPLSRLSCFLGAHEWHGSNVMGYAECASCGEVKEL